MASRENSEMCVCLATLNFHLSIVFEDTVTQP